MAITTANKLCEWLFLVGWDGPLSHEIWLDIKNAMSAAAPIVSPGYGMDSAGYLAYLNETMENIRDSGAYFNWWGCCAKKPIS
jgi:hypothetical protein